MSITSSDSEMLWSNDEEIILQTIGDKCFSMSEHHKKKYIELKNKLKFYKIPVIIISGINSVISVGMSDYIEQNIISAITCILALITGIIGSIELYLKLSDNMNSEFISGRDFYLLHIDIKKTLTLKRENRGVSGQVYMDMSYNKYIKLMSGAQVMVGRNLEHIFGAPDLLIYDVDKSKSKSFAAEKIKNKKIVDRKRRKSVVYDDSSTDSNKTHKTYTDEVYTSSNMDINGNDMVESVDDSVNNSIDNSVDDIVDNVKVDKIKSQEVNIEMQNLSESF